VVGDVAWNCAGCVRAALVADRGDAEQQLFHVLQLLVAARRHEHVVDQDLDERASPSPPCRTSSPSRHRSPSRSGALSRAKAEAGDSDRRHSSSEHPRMKRSLPRMSCSTRERSVRSGRDLSGACVGEASAHLLRMSGQRPKGRRGLRREGRGGGGGRVLQLNGGNHESLAPYWSCRGSWSHRLGFIGMQHGGRGRTEWPSAVSSLGGQLRSL
jgi:hypothetical protein